MCSLLFPRGHFIVDVMNASDEDSSHRLLKPFDERKTPYSWTLNTSENRLLENSVSKKILTCLFKDYGKGKLPTLGLIYQYPFFGDLMSISDEQFYLGHYKTAGKTKPLTL